MKKIQESIKGNTIIYDTETEKQSIETILDARFKEDKLIHDTSLADLYDPYKLKDMDKAVTRIKQAYTNKETVMIFGDYDVDGVTSTSILMHFFKKIGLHASYRLPHRVHDGYGLKKYFIDEFKKLDVDLLITVDCGSKDIDVIKYAKQKGIDVIVTDHHAVPPEIPPQAVAIINPKRLDCHYPAKNLAGAGVAFKLISALAQDMFSREEAEKYIQESIDIAAIGTVADCMTLTGENRIIVTQGLKQLKKSRSLGIRSMIEDKLDQDLDADIFSFFLGPRLNAAGRMDTPYKAINLILNNNSSVYETIREIEDLNTQRKIITQKYITDALEQVDTRNNLIIYKHSDIIHGIIGIVAGRLTEQFFKPSIVLKDEGEILVASCRSPEYFSMIELLDKYKQYFISYGGHKQAAGFSIKTSVFSKFQTEILADINQMDFSQYKKEIQVEKILKVTELGFGFIKKINYFKPYGIGNPKPIFMITDFDYTRISFLGKGRDHLKFDTKHGFKVFAFFMGEYLDVIRQADRIDLIFELSEDHWMGKKNLLLKVIDIIVY